MGTRLATLRGHPQATRWKALHVLLRSLAFILKQNSSSWPFGRTGPGSGERPQLQDFQRPRISKQMPGRGEVATLSFPISPNPPLYTTLWHAASLSPVHVQLHIAREESLGMSLSSENTCIVQHPLPTPSLPRTQTPEWNRHRL